MKKILYFIFFILFCTAFAYCLIFYNEITNKVTITFFTFLFGLWIWGQIFVEYKDEFFPFLFLVLKGISENIKEFIFIFSIPLLFFDSLYLTKEILGFLLAIILFFPNLSKSQNKEYSKKTILLAGLAILIFLDLVSFKSPNLTLSFIFNPLNSHHIVILVIYFIKTMLNASFYAILASCFYEALNEYFYKDTSFTFRELFKNFLTKFNKNMDRWNI